MALYVKSGRIRALGNLFSAGSILVLGLGAVVSMAGGCWKAGVQAVLLCAVLAIEGGTSAASGNAGASAGEFRSTCWECRKGKFARRRFSRQQCRSPRNGQGHTACDWAADPRESLGSQGAVGASRQQRWNAHFVELERFKGLYGHCSVPQSGRVHGERWCRLARWASKQRQMQRGGVLAPERTAKLLQLGFDFGNNTFVAAWEGHFAELVLFKQHRGHCEVPLKSPAGVSSSFRAWVDGQRRQFKSNSTLLTPARRMQLEAVGFVWDPHQVLWEKNLFALVKHYRGQSAISGSLPLRLRCWLHEQRSLFSRGKLPAGRLRMLQSSHVSWKALNQTESFMHRLGMLVAYKQQHGHCFVPMRAALARPGCERIRLGMWCAEQRRRNNLALLKGDRQQLLVQLDFPWRGFRRYDTLQRFSPEGLPLSMSPLRPARGKAAHSYGICNLRFSTTAALGAHGANSNRRKNLLLVKGSVQAQRRWRALKKWPFILNAGHGDDLSSCLHAPVGRFSAYPFDAPGALIADQDFRRVNIQQTQAQDRSEGCSPSPFLLGLGGPTSLRRDMHSISTAYQDILKAVTSKVQDGVPLWIAARRRADEDMDQSNCGLESFAAPPVA